MTGLETTFYIVGIVFMSLMLLIGIVTAVAIVVIRSKIVAIHKHVEERFDSVNQWVDKGEAVLDAVKKVAGKTKR